MERTMKLKSTTNVRKMTVTAILAAVSAVLMFFSVNVPLMPSFIKLDFSELPAVLAAYMLGPVSGVTVVFLKNLVNLFFTTTGGVGELSNFLLGSSLVLIAGIIFKKKPTKTGAVLGAFLGSLTMALFSVATNFFVVYPVYYNFLPLEAILGMYNLINPIVGTEPTDKNLLTALVTFNLPFTFIKGIMSTVVIFAIYKPLSPVFKKIIDR